MAVLDIVPQQVAHVLPATSSTSSCCDTFFASSYCASFYHSLPTDSINIFCFMCQARMNWRPRWKGEVKSCVRCSHLVEIGLEKKWSRRQLSLLLPARVLRLRLSPKPRASSRKEAAAATNRATGQALQTC